MMTRFLRHARLGLLWISLSLLVNQLEAQHDYKVSRNLIRAGKHQQALEVLEQRIAKFSKDSEWVYQKAIALGQLGRVPEAMSHLQRSLAMGVPTGRVASDSHDLLKSLAAEKAFQAIVQQHANQPVQGPMVGSVTDSTARIWLRTARAATVRVVLTGTDNKKLQWEGKTTVASDFTTIIPVGPLASDTAYQYQLVVNGEPVRLPYESRFRTWPKQGSGVKFRFAFGGGAGYVTGHEHMWDTIGKSEPSVLFMLGDNMYSDDPESSQMQRFCYYRRQSSLSFRKLVARTQVYSIWDDHDFGTNDCSGGPEINSPAWKIPVWNVYQQNWANPAYGGGRKQPGCWYEFYAGDIHFIMLDGRYYRHRKDKTMLGPAQKAWLKKTLLASSGTFKVVASPVPWDYRTKGDSKDTWNGFKEERTEIFDFLAENKIEGVLLMSADRHRSDAWKIDRPNGYSLYEFNSSRLTNNHVHKTMKEAIFSYNKKQSFGLVEFDTTVDDPSISYTVISIDGEKIHNLRLNRSMLK
ncbi:MAG TPA: alkaline phosphatase [Planctomycetaceae bacterium]|nr:alkaline phosphatase [Planctomycetaceae bacterium]